VAPVIEQLSSIGAVVLDSDQDVRHALAEGRRQVRRKVDPDGDNVKFGDTR
jgi:hypothetical protein